MAASHELAVSFRAAALLLLTLSGVLAVQAARRHRALGIQWTSSRAHWVQLLMHGGLFAGWAPLFPAVVEHVPHFLAQILFYYAFESLLGWLRRDAVRIGFGALPIVGSTNLFLWFRDEWFGLQFAMLAVGAMAKELLLWERDGQRSHVFNPSSFPLFLACLILWIADADAITWAGDIAVSQGEVPNGWLGIFLLGLVVQSLFAVTLVTLGALFALFVANQIFTAVTGVYLWVDVGIPVAVYLGCHFLITDPATSPRTARGRAVFGVLYGLSVFGLYAWLRVVEGPAHYDKLLCVPFLNLLVQRLDRLGGPRAGGVSNRWHVALAIALFAGFFHTGFLGDGHPGRELAFWEEACAESRWLACRTTAGLLDDACHAQEWPRCEEVAHLSIAGVDVPRDLANAGYHRTLACQHGVEAACQGIAAFRREGGDDALREACDADDGLSCIVLGTLLLGELGGPAAPEEARERLGRACELGLAEACVYVEASSREE